VYKFEARRLSDRDKQCVVGCDLPSSERPCLCDWTKLNNHLMVSCLRNIHTSLVVLLPTPHPMITSATASDWSHQLRESRGSESLALKWQTTGVLRAKCRRSDRARWSTDCGVKSSVRERRRRRRRRRRAVTNGATFTKPNQHTPYSNDCGTICAVSLMAVLGRFVHCEGKTLQWINATNAVLLVTYCSQRMTRSACTVN